MNDNNKFKVMCGLGAVWLIMLIAMVTGVAKIHPRVEILVWAICIGWFAYWTISYVWSKPSTPEVVQPEQPKTNVGKSKKTPKA